MSAKVRKANKASTGQLLKCASEGLNTTWVNYLIPDAYSSTELGQTDRKSIWEIFETNMFVLYSQSSFGWDPSSKHDELFSPLSRFILIDIDDKLAAFSMFRFEYEEEENILYCYDLQIQLGYQRKGLGKMLMDILEKIGAAWGMEKVMLTVFKANQSAIRFYQVVGFVLDESSPDYVEEGNDSDTVEDPPPPGQKRVKEDWENIWYIGMYGSMAFAAVMLYYKPDTSIQTWALEEAKRRMEERGEKYKYEPSTPPPPLS
ncbi:hypothetical protein C0993_007562 [Termitomyces sp. T159_Od127]|nr:hypothetical protein C0993_007562 [Termitomyces sp. T159_Od127]